MIFTFGINIGIVQFLSSGKIGKQGLKKVLKLVSLLFISLFVLIYFIDSFLNKNWFGGQFGFGFKLFIVISIFVNVINAIIISILQGLRKFKKVNTILVLNATLSLIFIGGYFFFNTYFGFIIPLPILFFLSLIAPFFSFILFFYWMISKSISFDSSNNGEVDVAAFFKFVLPGYLSLIINFLNYRFDFWVLESYHGLEDLGQYSLSANIGQIFSLITGTAVSVILPTMNTFDDENRRKFFMKYFRLGIAGNSLLAILAFIVAPVVIPLFYGIEFKESAVYFRLLLPGLFFSNLNQFLASFILSNGGTRYNLFATVVGCLFTISLNFILIPRYGSFGACIVSCISYFVIFLIVSVISSKNYGLNYFQLINK